MSAIALKVFGVEFDVEYDAEVIRQTFGANTPDTADITINEVSLKSHSVNMLELLDDAVIDEIETAIENDELEFSK